ncbi:MAG: adenylate kinase [Solirubrobacterales bacterium]|nr:adenylate kinase [Solirubrobacterales bacterium]
MSELNLIFLGAPGSGKGTQAQRLMDDFDIAYIATGDMLREEVAQGTPLGTKAKLFMDKGDLVPDDVIIAMIAEKLSKTEAHDGFILDGFPRTIAQADALSQQLTALGKELSAVLLIEVSDDEVVRRISGRRVSATTGRVYHVDLDPPKHEGRCDVDGARLLQRDDDKPETVKKRLSVYHQQTAPLISYYGERDLLRRFDGTRSPTEVHDHVRATLATLRLEELL